MALVQAAQNSARQHAREESCSLDAGETTSAAEAAAELPERALRTGRAAAEGRGEPATQKRPAAIVVPSTGVAWVSVRGFE